MTMSKNSTTRLAERLLGNWMSKNPVESVNIGVSHVDDELQSLNWLLCLPRTERKAERIETNPKAYIPVVKPKPIAEDIYSKMKETGCSRNPYTKPAYSYANLITMAIEESPEKKISLSSLYKWISDHFPYYRKTDTHWKNSVRHNLSVSKRFEKVPRRPNESGKGGFWRIKSSSNDVVTGKRKLDDISLQTTKQPRLDTGYVSRYSDPCMDGIVIKTENDSDKYDDYLNIKQSTPSSSDDEDNSPCPSSCYKDATHEDLSCFNDLLLFDFNEKRGKIETIADPLCLPDSNDGFRDHDLWLELSNSCDSLPTNSIYDRSSPFTDDFDNIDLFTIPPEDLM